MCAEGFALLQLSRACVQLTATQEQKVCQNALSIITLFMKHFDTLFIAKIHPRKGKDRFIGHAACYNTVTRLREANLRNLEKQTTES